MEYEKNIEEMAEGIESELKVYFGAGDVVAPEDFPYQARGIAESLAKKGYRKESDTAREILTELLKEENLEPIYFTDIKGNIRDRQVIRIEKIKDLAEKYGVDLGE